VIDGDSGVGTGWIIGVVPEGKTLKTSCGGGCKPLGIDVRPDGMTGLTIGVTRSTRSRRNGCPAPAVVVKSSASMTTDFLKLPEDTVL